MTENKKTKLDYLNDLKNIVTEVDSENVDLIDFVSKEILTEESRRAKAEERAAAKRAANEPLINLILSLLTDDYQTIEEITALVDDSTVSRAKVTARLNQLCKDGKALKSMIKVDSRNLTGYKAAAA